MKRLSTLLLLGSSIFSSGANADFLSVSGSIQSWEGVIKGAVASHTDFVTYTALSQDPEGKIVFSDVATKEGDLPAPVIPTFNDRGVQFQYLTSAWIALEHPFPFAPNIRLAITDVSYQGDSASWAPTQLAIDPRAFTVPGRPDSKVWALDNVLTNLDMNVNDISFYWQTLDNWIDLDLGLTIRQMSGTFLERLEAEPVTGRKAQSKRTPIDLLMPLLYFKAGLDVPFIDGLFLSATTSAMSAGGATMIDVDAEIGYWFDFVGLGWGATFGYRYSGLDATNFQKLYADASISGIKAGLMVQF